ncbi:MAG: hypothetical protein A3H91_04960 [Gammaproteobacteria bacterium RIFCSPLOWO2_02_FULL_61_13]|nr:MAG: hypothetical protein A3H91_04960 [Gammaproteobacteria bacterium RIFCSPLOWO2_02_FULL_61_13]
MLVIPGMLTRNPNLIGKLGALALPALQRLLARGRRDTQAWPGIDAWLLERFCVERQEDWPSAPFALLGEGKAPGDACWAHAEPVSLRADRDRLLLADAALLKIQADEARAMVATIEGHFGEALRLTVAAPERWYARLATPPRGETTPLAAVAGNQITPGQGAMGWHVLMNEMQMLLHEHPLNQAREARGELPLNGIWLWGAGKLAPASTQFKSMAGGHPLALGLARHAGIAARALPASAGRWVSSVASQGIHVCVHDGLLAAANQGDFTLWLDTLARLEHDWFAPLHEALEAGRIGMVTLSLGGARTLASIETIRQDLRRFWRRPQPLDRTLDEQADAASGREHDGKATES